MLEIIKLKHNSPEWLEFRNKGIGASEAAAVLGLSKYKSNTELWEEKVGIRKPKDISQNEIVAYGSKAEEYLVGLFALHYKDRYKVTVNKSVVYLKDGFQFASLDGEIEVIGTKELGIYEGKSVLAQSRLAWEEWNDKIPQQYYIQCLHQMLVTGRKFVVIKPEFRWVDEDGEIATKTQCITIRQTPTVLSDIRLLDEAEHEFWQYVKKGVCPQRLLPKI